jgi:transaldolase / glucose-6-phosphate isomerase
MTNHPTAHEAGPDSGAQAQQTWSLGDAASDVYATLREWRESGKVQRLWAQDPALWSGTDEDQWLGWLDVVEQQRNHNARLAQLVADIRGAGFASAVLLGMGGSSLCPEVLSKTFGTVPGFPRLLMIDSTVPAQIIALERRLDLTRTLFIVSSKSGGTTETKVLTQYFFARVQQAVGAERAGSHFVAITDPGTALHKKAEADHFRHIMPGMPSIGGRYSAMSNFGVVPAAIMGVDVPRFLGSTEIMVRACAAQVPPEVNPGVALGVILGTLAQKGRDKVTLITSPVIGTLGAWLEQLLAESTGKQSKGLIPVDEEQLGPVQVYRQDRLFIYLRCNPAPAQSQRYRRPVIQSCASW